ncbi:nitric oxide reductase activation protein NorD [Allopusillimonas ginsengisoli]|uniref:nitric oxide reductase activation protein NorD n=1 Tax=Allopusillimonas ginsengisoli TaxID=453575 RepID=UPI0010C2231A|nr:VWA domain-containing protein [Allopusillimonas ginsengisoli]
MAEAEDVLQDAARHATIYARQLWLRRRGDRTEASPIILAEVSPRLDLLITAIFNDSPTLRVASPPAIPTVLTRLFRRHDIRQSPHAVPATNGTHIWLPGNVGTTDMTIALERYRAMALLQAMRLQRGSAQAIAGTSCPITSALYLILEAYACDQALVATLPGMARSIAHLREWALNARPEVGRQPPLCRPIEGYVRSVLQQPVSGVVPGLPLCETPEQSLSAAQALARTMLNKAGPKAKPPHTHALHKDWWTGELLPPDDFGELTQQQAGADEGDDEKIDASRSARMQRRPKERKAEEGEDDNNDPGMIMVQPGEPLEKAEDPMGMQRPTDRDQQTSAEDYADALSELPEARLITSPGKPKEVLLSEDPPDKRSTTQTAPQATSLEALHYPEWDYRINGYHHPGATVRLLTADLGPQAWIDKTLASHKTILDTIRKRFEMLRADRQLLRRQLDGDDIDLDAYIEGAADVRAGLPMPQALYQKQRTQARDMAIMLLIDISGSTDSYLADHRRIIDVEREALLLVAIALDRMGEPYSIQAFSGNGPDHVTVSTIKGFTETYNNTIAQRIAALEPQQYTRAGAALRHATTMLMKQPAKHRLLLLLSDGKPNDVDHYEGRYGVEDMRRAVDEAKMQGVFPFCLTIDRQAAKYLPAVFGARQYALLSRPEALPTVLLDWMRRLVSL